MRTKNQDSAAGRFRARVRRQEQIFGLCDNTRTIFLNRVNIIRCVKDTMLASS